MDRQWGLRARQVIGSFRGQDGQQASRGPLVLTVSRLRREPLIHFVLIAAGLFVLNHLAGWDRREQIRIAQETIDYLADRQAELMQRPLDSDERRQLVEDYIDEEVLLREAYRQGLDQDGRIRRQMIGKMRFLLAGELPDPTGSELRAWYADNIQRFEQPAVLDLDHVFFQTPEAVPDDLLDTLQDGADWRVAGDFDPALGYVIRGVSERDLANMLGGGPARQVFSLKGGRWSGTLTSRRGAHLFRVRARTPARQPSFSEVAQYLEDEWLLEQQQRRVAKKVAELRANYRIAVKDATNR